MRDFFCDKINKKIYLLDNGSISNYIGLMKPQAIISLISKIRYGANNFIIMELEKHGITGIAPSHGEILVRLFAGNAIPMSELAQAINKKKNTLTTLVDKLINLGYVEKIQDSSDARVSLVVLTGKGRSLKPHFDDVSEKLIAAAYRGMSEGDSEKLFKLLVKMNENFSDYA